MFSSIKKISEKQVEEINKKIKRVIKMLPANTFCKRSYFVYILLILKKFRKGY